MLHGNKPKILNAIDSLVKIVDGEILIMTKCIDCYELMSSYGDKGFKMVCNSMHPIIWAKSADFGYWPAKAISFEKNMVFLKYFGDHAFEAIPLESCYEYSPQPPEGLRSDGDDDSLYLDALKVC